MMFCFFRCIFRTNKKATMEDVNNKQLRQAGAQGCEGKKFCEFNLQHTPPIAWNHLPARKKTELCDELTSTYTFSSQTKGKYTVAGRTKLICGPSRRLWNTTLFSRIFLDGKTQSPVNTILLLQCRSVFSPPGYHSSACCSVKRLLLQVSKNSINEIMRSRRRHH